MHPARGSIKREGEMEMGSISNFCSTCQSSQDANFFLLFCDVMHEVARLPCHLKSNIHMYVYVDDSVVQSFDLSLGNGKGTYSALFNARRSFSSSHFFCPFVGVKAVT